MTLYLLLMTFLNNEIQVLKHRVMWVNRKKGYLEKSTSFDLIPSEYFGQSMNFSSDPPKSLALINSYPVTQH